MPSIDVDFDVFKAITMRRSSEDVSDNDVLRALLGLPPRSNGQSMGAAPAHGEWITKGVRFPTGTEFKATYKGRTHLARVEDGALVLNGKPFDSPSAAAVSITGHPTNGWRFWRCRRPGQSQWQLLEANRTERS